MKESRRPVLENALNVGAIGGISIALFYFLLAIADKSFSSLRNIGMLFLIIVLAKGIGFLRDRYLGGYISYKTALKAGILISAFVGVFVGFYAFLEYSYIKPENLNAFLELQKEMLSKGSEMGLLKYFNPEKLDQAQQIITPGYLGKTEWLTTLIWGSVFSLIIAAFVKRTPPETGVTINI